MRTKEDKENEEAKKDAQASAHDLHDLKNLHGQATPSFRRVLHQPSKDKEVLLETSTKDLLQSLSL